MIEEYLTTRNEYLRKRVELLTYLREKFPKNLRSRVAYATFGADFEECIVLDGTHWEVRGCGTKFMEFEEVESNSSPKWREIIEFSQRLEEWDKE